MIIWGNKFFHFGNRTFIGIILSIVRGTLELSTQLQLSFRSILFTSLSLLSLIGASISWATFKISFWNNDILSIFNSLRPSSRLFCRMRSCVVWLTLKFSLSNMELTFFSDKLISLSGVRDIVAIVCTSILKFPLRHKFVISNYNLTLPLYSFSWIVINICWESFKFTP